MRTISTLKTISINYSKMSLNFALVLSGQRYLHSCIIDQTNTTTRVASYGFRKPRKASDDLGQDADLPMFRHSLAPLFASFESLAKLSKTTLVVVLRFKKYC